MSKDSKMQTDENINEKWEASRKIINKKKAEEVLNMEDKQKKQAGFNEECKIVAGRTNRPRICRKLEQVQKKIIVKTKSTRKRIEIT